MIKKFIALFLFLFLPIRLILFLVLCLMIFSILILKDFSSEDLLYFKLQDVKLAQTATQTLNSSICKNDQKCRVCSFVKYEKSISQLYPQEKICYNRDISTLVKRTDILNKQCIATDEYFLCRYDDIILVLESNEVKKRQILLKSFAPVFEFKRKDRFFKKCFYNISTLFDYEKVAKILKGAFINDSDELTEYDEDRKILIELGLLSK